MCLLLQILHYLPPDSCVLHRLKHILGFSQGQPQLCGPERLALQTSYVFNGFCVSAAGFDNDLHLFSLATYRRLYPVKYVSPIGVIVKPAVCLHAIKAVDVKPVVQRLMFPLVVVFAATIFDNL